VLHDDPGHLGPQIDIHAGGRDLIFPHHENEIAQSEAYCDCSPFAKYWLHVGLLNIDGEKMSKSLGNFWMLRDVLAIHHPQTVRFFLLSAHYRKPIAYSDVNLEHASHRVRYLYRTAQAIAALTATTPLPPPDAATLAGWETALYAGMDDDFNTPVALAIVYEVARSANEWLTTKKLAKQPQILAQIAAAQAFFAAFATFTGVLAADPTTVLDEMQALLVRQLGIDLGAVDALLAERADARSQKDWTRADAARDALLAMHIQVMDTPEGTRFFVDPPAPDAPQVLELDDSANDHQSLT
jgi:cysteinyl-tRNA synthetase